MWLILLILQSVILFWALRNTLSIFAVVVSYVGIFASGKFTKMSFDYKRPIFITSILWAVFFFLSYSGSLIQGI